MASLTVRNVPDDAKLRFRQVAAAYGRSMEEHLRQLVIEAEFNPGAAPAGHVAEKPQAFTHQPASPERSKEEIVAELIKIADSAGDGVFDAGKYADIRFMTAKDAIAELRRLANGVSLPETPRMSTATDAPEL